MEIKRCNHCEMLNGVGWELSVGEMAICPNCLCMWTVEGYHALEGSVDGVKCAYPQPQAWSDSPAVKAQFEEKK